MSQATLHTITKLDTITETNGYSIVSQNEYLVGATRVLIAPSTTKDRYIMVTNRGLLPFRIGNNLVTNLVGFEVKPFMTVRIDTKSEVYAISTNNNNQYISVTIFER